MNLIIQLTVLRPSWYPNEFWDQAPGNVQPWPGGLGVVILFKFLFALSTHIGPPQGEGDFLHGTFLQIVSGFSVVIQ